MANARFLIISLALLGGAIGTWLVTNYQPQSVGWVFIALSLFTLVVSAAEPLILSSADVEDADDSGEAEIQPGLQSGIGVGVGFLGILGSLFAPAYTIAIPVVAYSVGQGFVHKTLSIIGPATISIFGAPILEEPFFLFTLPFILYLIFASLLKDWPVLAKALVVITDSIAFSLYHYFAYGGSSLVSGAFIGAAVFRLFMLILLLTVGDAKDEGFTTAATAKVVILTMIVHGMINAFTYAAKFSITGRPV